MKIVKKITFWILGIGVGLLVLLKGLDYYLYLIAPKCDGFQTDFLGQNIQFPSTLKQAIHKYGLRKKGFYWVSMPTKDPLLMADINEEPLIMDKKYFVPQLDGLLFCFVDMPASKIDSLENALEIKYDKKLEPRMLDYSFRHMKINDCIYLVVDRRLFNTNYYFGTKEESFGKDNITCRVGFYYKTSEKGIIGTFSDSF